VDEGAVGAVAALFETLSNANQLQEELVKAGYPPPTPRPSSGFSAPTAARSASNPATP
jgi:hypothetical protein